MNTEDLRRFPYSGDETDYTLHPHGVHSLVGEAEREKYSTNRL